MKSIEKLFDSAAGSGFKSWMLNKILLNAIPFNKSHKVRIVKVTKNGVSVLLPYRSSNLNHLNGLHACALATLCEYTAGISLLRVLGSREYRFIMKSLHMEYHYQGKKDARAELKLDSSWIESQIISPLNSNDSAEIKLTVEANDTDGKLLCTATVLWQIKKWSMVRTK